MSDNLKITITLDGTGLYYDPSEPIHIDALIAWALAPIQATQRNLSRDDLPEALRLPISKRSAGNTWVYAASALFPEGETAETFTHWRKRFRVGRAELTRGSPNLTNSTYRDWNMPMPLLLTHRMIGYAIGDRRDLIKLLRRIPALGKKRAHGHGRITGVEIERVDYDWSMTCEGRAMRWLPDPSGTRLVRPQPPYWNPHERVNCCEVGDLWTA
ncbi:hypothetical protein SFMTTN_2084 [Sulfuriferula multivorans]|uniref:Uncharacterized protein n=1 Tax=Sulfuriferula multivorans TaxID=1559896 RepID=A0A401JF63_9PROT|nr:hypothetical protein [Sulfuriferula multivorans]GBL46271.1 hypothetical protein SFMTTN_2084 [Sulfuriferula multivorans]